MEEIGMYEDSPEDLVHDVLFKTVWKGNSLGYPILGTQKCLNSIDKKMIHEYLSENYNPNNCVISVAGNYDEDKLLYLIQKHFGSWETKNTTKKSQKKARFISDFSIKQKDTEQIHICIAFNGIGHGDQNMYPLLAVNNIFGGGMSSNLFQKIREERGLVYSIYSYPSSYKNAGIFTIYAGMKPLHFKEVLKLIIEEAHNLVKNGIDEDSLNKSKEQLKGNYILGLESTNSRMNSIGKSELLLNRIYTPDEILEKIDKIDLESSINVINSIFDFDNISFSAVGNIDKDFDIQGLFKT